MQRRQIVYMGSGRGPKRQPMRSAPGPQAAGWGLALATLVLAGCPSSAPVTRQSLSGSPAGAGGAPQLVCYAPDGKLVVAGADGQNPIALRHQPPAELVALAAASGTLVGASPGQVWALLRSGAAPDPAWHSVAHWEVGPWSAEPLRIASYGPNAVVWMRGSDPGTIPAALEVTAQGQVIKETLEVAEGTLGDPWQSSHAPPGPLDRSFPAALRLLIGQVRMSGQLAREELFHSERSPWGGRLVAPDLGLEQVGDWPDAPLFYIGAAAGATPVPLQYKDDPLMFRSLLGYGATSQLYLDGRATKRGDGILVVAPPGSPGQGSRKGFRPLKARVVPGLRPPCAVVNADWHE